MNLLKTTQQLPLCMTILQMSHCNLFCFSCNAIFKKHVAKLCSVVILWIKIGSIIDLHKAFDFSLSLYLRKIIETIHSFLQRVRERNRISSLMEWHHWRLVKHITGISEFDSIYWQKKLTTVRTINLPSNTLQWLGH